MNWDCNLPQKQQQYSQIFVVNCCLHLMSIYILIVTCFLHQYIFLIHWFTDFFVVGLTYWLTHSLIDSLTDPLTHGPTHSLTYWLTHRASLVLGNSSSCTPCLMCSNWYLSRSCSWSAYCRHTQDITHEIDITMAKSVYFRSCL